MAGFTEQWARQHLALFRPRISDLMEASTPIVEIQSAFMEYLYQQAKARQGRPLSGLEQMRVGLAGHYVWTASPHSPYNRVITPPL